MTKQLPNNPNAEHLKSQARDFFRAIQSGDDQALKRVKERHPFSSEISPTSAKLADAQLVLAREYGFESWPKLKNHVDSNNQSPSLKNAIRALQAGKCCVLFDDESRENEGDLLVAAEKVTAETINFVTKYGRGTLCVAISEAHAKKLRLNLVNPNRSDLKEPAFLTSIDAAQGISTGVSASDRATTIRAAVADDANADSVKSPGHVFPLLGHPEGLKARAGHTEGSIRLMELAGLKPAAVICEILKDDGTMARWTDLVQFAQAHDIAMVRMSDLM